MSEGCSPRTPTSSALLCHKHLPTGIAALWVRIRANRMRGNNRITWQKKNIIAIRYFVCFPHVFLSFRIRFQFVRYFFSALAKTVDSVGVCLAIFTRLIGWLCGCWHPHGILIISASQPVRSKLILPPLVAVFSADSIPFRMFDAKTDSKAHKLKRLTILSVSFERTVCRTSRDGVYFQFRLW